MRIDVSEMHYRKLNELIYSAVKNGEKEIILDNVNGQRYIGAGLVGDVSIRINGVPGNDLGIFMDGPKIVVNGNAQDGVGNTMNSGIIIIQGNAGDIVGYSMRGGKIFIKGDVGYRTGIHMKAYKDFYPIVVVGGRARDFFGEYMAGGLLIVLGLGMLRNCSLVGNYVGTGMHGGEMYIRGKVEKYQLGKEVRIEKPNEEDYKRIAGPLKEFCSYFSVSLDEVMSEEFIKLIPFSHRPYGQIYAY
jgi:glutamate synthase domain-containing protein 3